MEREKSHVVPSAYVWDSPAGRALIRRLVRREVSLASVRRDLGLPDWECQHVRLSVRAIRRRAGEPRDGLQRKRLPLVQLLARKIDIIKEGAEPNAIRLRRLDQSLFRGVKKHLQLLLDSLQVPVYENEWNSWRRRSSRVVPDLRGADLSGIDLRWVRLHKALLADADLSACIARGVDFRHAQLRGSHLRHADLTGADLRGATLAGTRLDHTILTEANFAGANLKGVEFFGTVLNRANLRGADIRGALVWGASVWDVEYDEQTRQLGLRIASGGRDPFEPDAFDSANYAPDIIEVDNLDVAHLMSLLMKNPMMGTILDEASRRIVLLLGRFTGEDQATLEALRTALPRMGYVPIVFDFPELRDRDTIETIATLAGMSRFVIANLSQPRSTPLEAQVIIPQIAVPFVPIIRSSEKPFSMFQALQRKYSWVLPTVTYRSERQLLSRLQTHIIRPAEAAANRLRELKHPAGN